MKPIDLTKCAATPLPHTSGLLTRRKKPKEEDDKRRAGFLPWAATGLGAATLGAGYGLGSDEAWETALSALDSMKEHGDAGIAPEGSTILQHYAKTMSPAAGLGFLGYPATRIVPNFRQLGWAMGDTPLAATGPDAPNGIAERIANRLGDDNPIANFMRKGLGQPSAHITNDTMNRAAQAHYEAFADGPIPGYAHMLRGYEGHRPVSAELAGGVPRTHGEYFGPRFDNFIADYTRGQSGNGAMLLPNEFNLDYMPIEEQGNLLDQWTASLSPEELAELQRIETDQMRSLGYNNYKPMVEKMDKLRRKLKDIGITAGGAGVGGLAGSSLYRALTDDDEESWLGHAGSTAAGMGLGGAAGYFGGTAGGRAKIKSVIDKLMSMTKRSEDSEAQQPTGVLRTLLRHS